ncbi:hypothetical protein [Spiroplasma eriocheiris]|uniref:Uncharacterized protein n=1 Tax=Spiroplasma eriocheiris TaxID=315358 RepID=A0A0H3XIC4_9MOLU|nr:hypothetical protein [Spiroplasma eriocheiris]AHF57760.1 hypothetical protein SPE_0632 [Spiroplasma eriocheiris CCTCC M 207170]AKM54210.1 hypothetical protein SERIO_v1c06400 [Spiroplasma eriocheiris]
MSDKKTSHNEASIAAKVLHDPNATPTAKRLAASALAQSNSEKHTGDEEASFASKVLTDPNSSKIEKELAASVLSQAKGKHQ